MRKNKTKQIQNLLFEPELVKGKDNEVLGADKCVYQYEKYPFFSQWKKDFTNIILNAGWKSKRSKLKWSIKRKGKVVFFRIEVTQFKNENQKNKELLPTPTTMDAANNGDMTAAAKIMNGAEYRSSGERIQKTLTHAIHQEILQDNLELAEFLAKKEMVKRINLPKQEEFVEWIRSKTNSKGLSELTGIKLSKVEHWFRKDKSGFSYPSIEEWQIVSELLQPPTDLDEKMKSIVSIDWSAMLPTPSAFDYNSARTEQKWIEHKKKWDEKGVNLQMPLKQLARFDMLPKPTSTDYKDLDKVSADKKANGEKSPSGHQIENILRTTKAITDQMNTSNNKLNPQFVAEMMGYPTNWTELPFNK